MTPFVYFAEYQIKSSRYCLLNEVLVRHDTRRNFLIRLCGSYALDVTNALDTNINQHIL